MQITKLLYQYKEDEFDISEVFDAEKIKDAAKIAFWGSARSWIRKNTMVGPIKHSL